MSEIDIAEVRHHFIGVGVTETTITEITLVKENGVTMTTTTNEAVRQVVAEAEKGGVIVVDVIERRNRKGIDPEKDTKRLGKDLGTDIGIGLDRGKDPATDLETDQGTDPGKDLATDPGTDQGTGPWIGIETVVDLVIDLVTGEKGTIKNIGLVNAVAKVLAMGIIAAQMPGGNQMVASAQKIRC